MRDFSKSEVKFLEMLSHGFDVDEAERYLKLRSGAGAQRLARLKRNLYATTTAHLVAVAMRRGIIA